MLYSLLGRLVWNGFKVLLRRKYGPTYIPKPVLAGGAAALLAALALILLRARD
jgi:hypothetical protein